MRTIRIKVAGQSFSIKSDASEEHLADLAREVDHRYQSLKKKGGTRGDQDLMIMSMVAVSLLDELMSATTKYRSTCDAATAFVKQLIAKIDELLADETL
jgi:cell division protein ZapA (FtsZ GTPase activity inhibitor)